MSQILQLVLELRGRPLKTGHSDFTLIAFTRNYLTYTEIITISLQINPIKSPQVDNNVRHGIKNWLHHFLRCPF